MNRPIVALAALCTAAWALAQDPAPTAAPKRLSVVADALAAAKLENKRVLVHWLGDGEAGAAIGKALKRAPLSRQLLYEFMQAPLASADDAKAFGLGDAPALAVLDADGKQLAAFAATDLAPFDAGKLAEQLKAHHAAPLDAQALLDAAFAAAKKDGKRVFVHFDAPW
ncbi:MAG: hypothetical protein FJ301_02195 [Planctomycetes bacterium]|nr:hypothetical protein [Planctomycetota bacterium]